MSSLEGRIHQPALVVTDVVKVYGGTIALRGVSLTIAQGEIYGLVGENGAGKSTLVRIITGVEHPDSGSVHLPEPNVGSARVSQQGCAVIHQSLGLIEDATVAENIALGMGFPCRGGLISWRDTRTQATAVLQSLGQQLDPRLQVSELSVAQRAIVAIARAVAQESSIIILDEPTATLQAAEAETLYETLRALRDRGVLALLISHRLDEVLNVTDRIAVLRDGALVGTWGSHELDRETLIELVVGRSEAVPASSPVSPGGQPVLTVDCLEQAGIGPVSFDIRPGEIVGLSGRGGAGHLAIGEMLYGIRPGWRGTAALDGVPYAPNSPREALRRGTAYVPADRIAEGIAGGMTAQENLFLNPVGFTTRRVERKRAERRLKRFNVRPPEPERELSTFSGGNQQKVVLGRCLSEHPRLVILAEPTVAVDVGAKAEIYAMIRRVSTEQKQAVLLASSDFEEIARLSDRVIMLDRGRVSARLDSNDISVESVTAAALRAS